MHAAIREGLRLRSIREGNTTFAFRKERRVPLSTETLIWTSVTVPGDSSALLGVLLGCRHEEPTLYLCNNPSDYDAVGTMYANISKDLEARVKDRAWVQIAVGTRSDAKALASLAEASGKFGPNNPWGKQRKNGKNWDEKTIARARMLGAYLAHPAIIRAASPHQAALVVLTEELAEHYATPISDQERAHLGVHLAWLRSGTSYEHESVASRMLQEPVDHRPLGALDENITAARKHLRDTKDSKPLHDIVEKTLRSIRELQEEAFDLLISFTDGASVRWFTEREVGLREGAVQSIKSSLALMADAVRKKESLVQTTNYLAGSRKADARVRRFLRQEHANERDIMHMLRVDQITRAGARIEGEILYGKIVSCVEVPGRRNSEWLTVVSTDQPLVALDESDSVEVLDKSIEGRITRITTENAIGFYTLSLKGCPGNTDEIIEIGKAFPFGNISDAIKRRIGRDRTTDIDRDGGADPEDDRREGTGPKTSRFGGPSWTHDAQTPRAQIKASARSMDGRVNDLLKKYQR